MDAIIEWIMANGPVILVALTSIVAGASALANFTKTDWDNKVLASIAKVIDFLALNFFKRS